MSDNAVAWITVSCTIIAVVVIIILLILALRRRRSKPTNLRGQGIAATPQLHSTPHYADAVLGGVVADHDQREQAAARAQQLRHVRQTQASTHSAQHGITTPHSASGRIEQPGPAAAASGPVAAAPTDFTASVYTDPQIASTDTQSSSTFDEVAVPAAHPEPVASPVPPLGAGTAFEPDWMVNPADSGAPAPHNGPRHAAPDTDTAEQHER